MQGYDHGTKKSRTTQLGHGTSRQEEFILFLYYFNFNFNTVLCFISFFIMIYYGIVGTYSSVRQIADPRNFLRIWIWLFILIDLEL